MANKYTGYRYSSLIKPHSEEFHHIVTIKVQLFKAGKLIDKEQFSFSTKFQNYMPRTDEIDTLRDKVKSLIANKMKEKYGTIKHLPPLPPKYAYEMLKGEGRLKSRNKKAIRKQRKKDK